MDEVLGRLAEAATGRGFPAEPAILELCSAQWREEGRFQVVPSCSKPDSWGLGLGVPISGQSFLSPGQLFPSCSSCFVSRDFGPGFLPAWDMHLTGSYTRRQLSHQAGAPRWGQTEMWVVPHLRSESCQLLPDLRGTKSSFLWTIFGRGCGSGESSTLCICCGNTFCVQGLFQYCQEYLLFILDEIWQDTRKDCFK